MEHNLSIGESLRYGWAQTRAHSTVIFQALLTLFAVQIAQQVVSRVLGGTLEGGLADVVLLVVSIVLGVGFTLIILRLAQNRHASYQDIIPPTRMWLSYLGASIISAVIMLVPLLVALALCLVAFTLLPSMVAIWASVAFAIVGFVSTMYFMLRYVFVRYAILDDTDMIKSLRTSAHLTQGRKWWLLGFLLVMILINIVGVLLILVGLLVTIPLTSFAIAHVYVKLHAHHHASHQ